VQKLEDESIDYIVPRINNARIEPLKRYAPVLGNNIEALESPRNKWVVYKAAVKAGLNVSKTSPLCESSKSDKCEFPLILKPVRGCRGAGIKRIDDMGQLRTAIDELGADERHIVQDFIVGDSFNINFLANGNSAVPILVSKQLFEDRQNFVYSGNVGPVHLEGLDEFVEGCTRFLEGFNLKGIVGIDFMRDSRGEFYFIEMNPRIQGSFEVVEDSLGLNLFEYYFKALNGEITEPPRPKRVAGKNIVTTVCDCRAPNLDGMGFVRDIPYENALINAGSPICTVVATGGTASDVETKLDEEANFILNKMRQP
jgi:hypothetical protein